MKLGRHSSIRQKITYLVLLTCGVAVLVACSIFAIYDITTSRVSLERDLATLAQITGSNSTAAIAFNDSQSAEEILASLSAQSHIVEACIYTPDGRVFAKYSREGANPEFIPPPVSSQNVRIASGFMEVFRPIRLKDDTVGTIYVKSDLKELEARMIRFSLVILGVLLASFVAVYFSATRLERVISDPILELARTAFAVSTGQDYSLRATKQNNDEIGFLFDRFNEMLELIQQRDADLQRTRGELEIRVDERTRELQSEVADRKRAQLALEDRTAFLNSLIENSPVGIVVINVDASTRLCNPAFEKIFRFRQGDVLGQPLLELLAIPELRHEIVANENALLHGQTTHVVTRRRRGDATTVDVEAFSVPLFSAGKQTGALILYMDITERKLAEEALHRSKDAAEAASRTKSEFLANMSHEIRTPMNGIIGMTDLALDTNLTTEQREYLGMVKSSAASLLNLINDILDFSKIEAGKLDLDVGDFALRESVGETLKALAFRAHEKGLELAWHAAPDVPDHLSGDVSRLRQVLVNLVGNAVKFTERGEVIVEIGSDAASTETSALLHFRVRDTGIGITKDKHGIVFGAFTQADSSTTRKYGGTGLGLAITSRLVDLMGGKLWIESEPGLGSTFHFTIRFGIGTGAPPARNHDPRLLSQTSILVVDDNDTNRFILVELLGRWGMRVETAKTAHDALAILVRNLDHGPRFAAVITDLQMPDMDGFGLVENIRKHPQFGEIPVLLLSSSAQAGDRERCSKLGIAAYLTKPVQSSELLDAIMKALSPVGDGPSPRPAANLIQKSIGGKQVMKVLLAEDNAVNRTLAKRLLEKHGHTVVVVENGRQALEALEHHSVDLVLMDVQMPEMDGLEATAAIRQKESRVGGHVPIITLTAHAMKGDREKCLAAGADDYLTKPIRTPELFAALDRIQDAINKTGNAVIPLVSPKANASISNSFDNVAALEHVEGDRQLLDEIVRSFSHECPKTMSAIRTAIRAEDLPSVERAAHALRGSAGNLCAVEVTRTAEELENSARAGNLSASVAQFRTLDNQVDRLLDELEPSARKVTS